MLTWLDRITTRAESEPTATFNNLYSRLNYELLWYAFRKLKRDKAPGIDGVTVDQYEANLRENLQDLETRLHRQSYRPHPRLRRDIPKGNGRAPTRSVGRRPLDGLRGREDRAARGRDDPPADLRSGL
ncbi:MAG: hypothetical protein O3C40_08780 [Planctomycetota bacterium]|nr:hypothetical protein [Planctomycetota bacterium]